MNEAFHKIFWGYFLVFLEIHLFFFDILPDPIGYYLILLGILTLLKEFPIGEKARIWAIVLVLFSIPSVFVSGVTNETSTFFNMWDLYHTILGILKLILVFYLFQLMLVISKKSTDVDLYNWTQKFSTIYITIMLISFFITTFGANIFNEGLLGLAVIAGLTGFVLEIMLLVLFHRYKKLDLNG